MPRIKILLLAVYVFVWLYVAVDWVHVLDRWIGTNRVEFALGDLGITEIGFLICRGVGTGVLFVVGSSILKGVIALLEPEGREGKERT